MLSKSSTVEQCNVFHVVVLTLGLLWASSAASRTLIFVDRGEVSCTSGAAATSAIGAAARAKAGAAAGAAAAPATAPAAAQPLLLPLSPPYLPLRLPPWTREPVVRNVRALIFHLFSSTSCWNS